MKLVADENILGLNALPAGLEVTAVPGRAISRELLADADALWVRSVTRVDDDLLAGSRVRFVGTATAGTEHIDRAALERRGITFAAAPGANAMAVVEYVLAALAAMRRPWQLLEEGGALGVVGYGAVGQRFVAFARAMGWRVLACDPWVSSVPDDIAADLDAILACDVISLHCSLHRRAPWPSHHLIDGPALARLGAGQWLVNASRGAVLERQALAGHLAGPGAAQFVLDVWEGEPDCDWSLLASPNLHLATPHIAGYSVDAKAAATERLLEALQRAPGCPPIEGSIAWESVFARDTPAAGSVVGPAGNGGSRGPDAVDRLLRGVYDIRADDRAFRALLDVPDPRDRAAGFDALRRAYPLRRELSAMQIDPGRGAGDDAQRFLRALGAARTAGSGDAGGR